ncbi:MAG: EamA family transporter [Alphaproteobacteria bacterium]|nr:EamA family transporter [Alphaproteobacteria bacterium]
MSSPSTGPGTAAGNLRGTGWMLLTGLFFVAVTGIVRHLGTDMNPIQAAFIRYGFGFVLMIPIFMRLETLRPSNSILGLYLARGLLHGIGVSLWFFAMARIPIAEVTALGFTAPIFTTIGAALFLGEKLRIRRIGAVLIGFGGTLIILRPGFEAVSIGALAQVAAAPVFAGSFLIAKKLTETESSTAIVAFLSIIVTIVLLPPALLAWRTPTVAELGLLFAVAALATAGHVTLTQAFKCAEITVTQPAQFLQLVWATLLGLLVFGEQPVLWTWVGGAIIVASATYIAHRETRQKEAVSLEPEIAAEAGPR